MRHITHTFPQRISAFLLCLALCLGLLPTSALAADSKADTGVFTVTGGTLGTDYTYTAPNEYDPDGGEVLTIKGSAALTISTNSESGTSSGCRIVISDNVTANITLAGVNITPADAGTDDGYSGIDLGSGATLNITLQSGSSNVINGGISETGTPAPGIRVPGGSTLTIDGDGSLEVKGASADDRAAVGIGGMGSSSENGEACGNVIILGGTITVHGGTASTSSPPVDIGGGATDTEKGGDCNTVIILTSVNSGEGLEIGGGKGLSSNDGSDGAGIKPTGDGTYTVYGNLELPCDITIPEGATVVIPEGASLTVPEDKTLTNNGTILVQGGTFTGDVTGNPPTYPSKVTVSFSQNGEPVNSVPYGSTVTITATMERAETATNALSADPGKVDFYLGDANDTTEIKMGIGTVEFENGAYTASVNVTINQDKGFNNAGTFKFTADFGGYAPEGDESGDSLAPNTGSAQLTVTKAEQAKPTGSFILISSTENSLSVNFVFSDQPVNENGVEIAYAEGLTPDAPTGDWITAEKISNSSIYSATIGELSPGTPYVFFARYKGDDTHEPSPSIVSDFAPHTKPKINTTSLPNAYVGVEYSKKLEAVAAEGVAVNWAIFSGSLPAGLTLNSDGTITGTPITPTTQVAIFTVKATIGEGASSVFSTQTLTISVTKSDAELGNLTVSGNTGYNGKFQYGDIITVTFTPERKADTSTNALAENTATLTYTPDSGETVTLATATAQADGSFTLTYDTREKKLPCEDNMTLTVSYGGSGELNPAEKATTVSLESATLKNLPTITGIFEFGQILTAHYEKQDDETVTYQWLRDGANLTGATEITYTLTEEDIGKNIEVKVIASDYWHYGSRASNHQMVVSKAPGSIEIACDSVTYGETVQPSVTSNTNTGADVTYSYAGTGSTSYGPSSEAPQNAGTYTVTATVAETATHTAATSEPVTFTIEAPPAPPYIPPTKPDGPSTGASDGWTGIQEEIADADKGDTITIDMNGETEVPGEIFEEVAGKDVTVEIDMGDVTWTVNGQDVPTGTDLSDLDLGVDLGTKGISVDVINTVTGELGSVQITLAHDGEFGFTLTLTAPLGKENAGYWANLYHYDEDAKTLNYETSAQINDKGDVSLRMTHASQYAIVIDDKSHDLPFTDVAEGAWYESAVRYAYTHDIMEGMSATTFQPNGTLSRAMAVQIFYNLEGQPDISDENLGYLYEDVDAQAWYGDAVYWARITGVATGYGDGTFRPENAVTRQEFAQMLYNYAKYKGYDLNAKGDLTAFPDGDSVQPWAETAMTWANGNQLINGHDDGTLEPGGTTTRAQASSILMRFDQNVVEN